ncbi:MAG: ATP-binding cassette domain-containing protein [Fusobacteriales bacterium]|jgi:ABC-type lipoprotein export system ATPase subunit|nr:ATP-binding cassette domain-containing protein [Fusobacteriales bacterium]
MIKFEDIHKKYKNAEYEVLDGLNLEISDGEFIHLKGKSGKSTVLHFIYLMDRPTSGKVFYGEKELNKLKFNFQRARIRRKIGYVYQDLWLLDDRTVYENIKISTDLLKVKSKERNERVDEILSYFDLENIKKQKIGQLSYQEKILVEISRELAKKPELLILDEVFEKLKKNNKEKLLKHLYKINEEGTTVIAVTSEENLFDERIRVIDLDGGKTDVESD